MARKFEQFENGRKKRRVMCRLRIIFLEINFKHNFKITENAYFSPENGPAACSFGDGKSMLVERSPSVI